jgi:hypothetical protein
LKREEDAKMKPPSIPVIENDDLREAVIALARSAWIMRGLFRQAESGRPIKQLLQEHEEAATVADEVIDKWMDHLGISDENELE